MNILRLSTWSSSTKPWLYALSLQPSIIGLGVSAVLIEYSLAYVGLAIIFGFNGITTYKIRKKNY